MNNSDAPDVFCRYPLLDPLRGIASIWVFLFHYHFSGDFQHRLPYLHEFLKVGKLGVAMFFVISGFCLTLAARRSMQHGQSPLTFLKRRATRIYPTFWASIVFILLLRACVMHVVPEEIAPLGPKLPAVPHYTAFDWMKVVTLGQQFDQRFGVWFARFSGVNSAYWSLAIEFQFYLVVTLGLYFPKHFYRILGLLALTCVPFAVTGRLFFPTVQIGFFLPYWPWFACGIGTFWLLDIGLTPNRVLGQHARTMAWIFGGVLVALVAIMAHTGIRIDDFIFAMATAAVLWLSASNRTSHTPPGNSARRLFVRTVSYAYRPLATFGAMSYSLYLVHNEVFYSLQRLLMWRGLNLGTSEDLLVACGTLALAFAFYFVCERPFLRSPAAKTAERPQEVAAVANYAKAA